MKTKEELSALREEVEALNRKLAELSEEELRLVAGGSMKIILFPSPKLPSGTSETDGGGSVGFVPGLVDISGKPLDTKPL